MDSYQTVGLIGAIGALVLVLSGLIARRLPGGQIFRYVLIWGGLFVAAYMLFMALGFD